ncbi:hypothetical protein SGRA_0521 [Saprospira grandis str. Lewin]|uniref:Uncharacterized protein n=1 Tax=Saprospira grandis (strain Lewin) TaxID=984262 RepID=H6L9T2_SAPGL|nr:hypothetical protein SGRA_0521 [Saprospira grandis str. Lewin]
MGNLSLPFACYLLEAQFSFLLPTHRKKIWLGRHKKALCPFNFFAKPIFSLN